MNEVMRFGPLHIGDLVEKFEVDQATEFTYTFTDRRGEKWQYHARKEYGPGKHLDPKIREVIIIEIVRAEASGEKN